MIHGELVWLKLLTAVVADAFVELVFPPGRFFKFAGFVALFANALGGFGVRADFVIRFASHKFFKRKFPLSLEGEG